MQPRPNTGAPSENLGLRVASAAILGAFVVAVVLAGGVWFFLTLVAFACVAMIELLWMLGRAGFRPFRALSLALALALVAQSQFGTGPLGPAVVAMGVMGSLLCLLFFRDRNLADWATGLAAALYLGGLLQYFGWLRDLPNGGHWVLSLLVLTWWCDAVAYFVGRRFGRMKLAPSISPNKSVEGAVAGVAAAVAAAPLIALAGSPSAAKMAGFGLVVAVAAVAGDLSESVLKRLTGVKDSSALIPGHGGFLDRMDALLFGAPLAYLYVVSTESFA